MDDREYQPEFGADEPPRARRAVARKLAQQVIKEFRFSAPPVDIAAIVQGRGLRLVEESVPGALSGQLFPKQREIFVNTHDRSIARQRFTAAHELGHWEMRH